MIRSARLPLVGIVGMAAVVAIGRAAIRSGSGFWLAAYTSAEVLSLLVAVVLARYGARRDRAFWFGFALVGWSAHAFAIREPYRWFRQDRQGESNLILREVVTALANLIRKPSESMATIDADADRAVGVASTILVVVLAVVGGLVVGLVRDRVTSRSGGTRPARGATAGRIGLIALLLASACGPGIAGAFPRASDDLPAIDGVDDAEGATLRKAAYARRLAAMGEPSLTDLIRRDPTAEAYRFLTNPSFDHPSAIRIVRDQAGATIRVVALDGQGGYDPGSIGLDRAVRISEERWAELIRRLDSDRFWSPAPRTEPEDDFTTDATRLIIEGVRGGRYRGRESYEREDDHSLLFRWVRRLTGVDFDERHE